MSKCIFNCGKNDKNLAKLKNLESWKSLLDVALSKNSEPIIRTSYLKYHIIENAVVYLH